MALVDSLRSTDSAFSLGEGTDGLMCVRFGMLTPQSDVEELLNLVIRVGQSVEENSRVLDSMSEIVKKGLLFFFWIILALTIKKLFRHRNRNFRPSERKRRTALARRHFTTSTCCRNVR